MIADKSKDMRTSLVAQLGVHLRLLNQLAHKVPFLSLQISIHLSCSGFYAAYHRYILAM